MHFAIFKRFVSLATEKKPSMIYVAYNDPSTLSTNTHRVDPPPSSPGNLSRIRTFDAGITVHNAHNPTHYHLPFSQHDSMKDVCL